MCETAVFCNFCKRLRLISMWTNVLDFSLLRRALSQPTSICLSRRQGCPVRSTNGLVDWPYVL